MKKYEYCNQHKHSWYTNCRQQDVCTDPELYAIRAQEIGDRILSSCEHGFQGNIWQYYELAQKYGLKFLFAAEAYWVLDRFEKDSTNCHIFLAAKNEHGRQAITEALSDANEFSFYRQPRLDPSVLMSLPPEDVWCSSACIAGWKYGYDVMDPLVEELHNHFGDNFFLEVQPHVEENQIELNNHILKLHDKLKIPLLAACDSHYIKPEDAIDRINYLETKGIRYEDSGEQNFILDYPDGNTLYQRFASQGVLNGAQIEEAMSNTLVFSEVEEYDSPIFTKEVKLPSLYPDWSQEQKNEEYKRLVWEGWEKYKYEVPEREWEHYIDEINNEIKVVVDTGLSDYFIIDYHVMKRGKELGGQLTHTGRGSAVSFLTNTLLGFSEVDRISAKIHMYPSRFISTERVLETKSLADIDMNEADSAPFLQAQSEIMGACHSYPMIAYGTSKVAASFKLYAKSAGIPFEAANKVSEGIKKYESALKHAEEDEKDFIDIEKYIPKEYKHIFDESKVYLGTVTSWSIAPCSSLIYQGDIRKEIGLVRVKDEICTLLDGHAAEDYKFLKNDHLIVSVLKLINQAYAEAKVKVPTVNELLKMCTPEDSCWSIYEKGITLGINQVEQEGTRAMVEKYKPKNISELTTFIAAIRPGGAGSRKPFLEREHFSFNFKPLDDLIQTEELPESYIFFQEQVMSILHYAGFKMSDCYSAIKSIAKKKVEKVLALKEQFVNGMVSQLVKDGMPKDKATAQTEYLWQVVEDNSRYSFNSSHAYCVALDSLYGAWLKAHHPLAFYKAYLAVQEAKGDKDKMNAAKEEAESYFGIKFPSFRFGQDNRDVVANPITNEITNPLSSIKGYSKTMARACYECAKQNYKDFVDVLAWFDARSIKTAKLLPLIRIDYFEQFGNAPTLSRICDIWDQFHQGKAKQIRKDSIPESLYGLFSPYLCSINAKGEELKTAKITDAMELVRTYEHHIKTLEIPDVPYKVKMQNQLDILGYVDLTTRRPEDRRKLIITDCTPQKSKTKNEIWAYRVGTKSIGTGKTARLTIRTDVFDREPLAVGDIVFARDLNKNKAGYWYLNGYERLV